MRVALQHLEAMARGEGRITNLPADFRFVAFQSIDSVDVGVIVHSQSYKSIPDGAQLPTFTAWFQRHPQAEAA
jgi:hypothetical protein